MSNETSSLKSPRASLRLAEKTEGRPATVAQFQPHQAAQDLPRQYVSFTFYKMRPEWGQASAEEKERAKAEFTEAVMSARPDLLINYYSLVGLRATADLMIWRIGYELDPFQDTAAKINQSAMGKYLEVSQQFLSMTKRSNYIDKENPDHDEDRLHVIPGKGKYLFVYPFIKTRPWYMLSYDERQTMMDEHIKVGMKYKSVKLHTTYSFGLDDQEFVVAFETEYPSDFLDLVQELRETQASMYTLRDTPMYTCRQVTLAEGLDMLG